MPNALPSHGEYLSLQCGNSSVRPRNAQQTEDRSEHHSSPFPMPYPITSGEGDATASGRHGTRLQQNPISPGRVPDPCWCNGSTTVFGTVRGGSNPSQGTRPPAGVFCFSLPCAPSPEGSHGRPIPARGLLLLSSHVWGSPWRSLVARLHFPHIRGDQSRHTFKTDSKGVFGCVECTGQRTRNTRKPCGSCDDRTQPSRTIHARTACAPA